MADELTFLRFFYHAVRPALGPADSEIYGAIHEEYEEETGNPVPSDYRSEA